ncbi:uncharacterized protein LOC6558631 [Drosophila grimshawi]|uniref:GH15821 n=1 Tax=Drosophila grimshawi TaxID=7222 RepID=B4IZQ9_DROGR|nr:uncharacterized protein LOC6558631 [Drosophila grimshawi]EDV95644.1 GH15821 [Drosophila grimshawi]
MISHTVRVFKLMYIVAGILISNEEICDTVDRIQIAPRVEMKPELEPERGQLQQRGEKDSPRSKRRRKVSVTELAGGVVRGVTSKVTSKVITSRLGSRLSWVYDVPQILGKWRSLALSFTVWTIPNWLMEYTSSYISRKFFLNSDCDLIYK